MNKIEDLAKLKPEKWQVIANNIDANFTEVSTNVSKKLDAVEGKQLSTEDYTTVEKTKLSGIAENANNYQHPANHAATMITEDATHRFVTDEEKTKWNGIETNANKNKEDLVLVRENLKKKLNTDTYNTDKITFALKTELPNLEGYAKETWVTEQIANAKLPDSSQPTDTFATKEELNTKADKTDLGGLKFWKGNKQAYEAISPKDENTLYIVIE